MIAINLLTYNELLYIKNLIRQFKDMSDEIYICDAYSMDGTWEWLNDNKKKYNLRLFQRKWDWKVGEQRNFLLSKTPKDCWVIKIDADEIPTFGFRYFIKKMLDEGENLPDIQNIFYFKYNLVNDLSHYHEDIGVECRIFWNSEKQNVHFIDEPHETIHGDWQTEKGVFKFEQGVVHLKMLDKEKVRIGRTDYVKNGFYSQDHIGDVLASDKIVKLPTHIGFDITTELINHLGINIGVICGV